MKRLRAALLLLLASAHAAAAGPDDMLRGLRLKKEGNFAAAEAAFERAVASSPGDLDALMQLATVQGWLKRYLKSSASWEKALKLSPNCAECRIGLARVLFWSGDRARALEQIRRALAANRNDFEAHSLRGDVLAAAGQVEEARASYLRAQELGAPGLENKLRQTLPVPRWRVDTGFITDHYSRLRGVEHDAYGQLGRAFPGRGAAWFRFDHQKQFSLIDRTFQVGGAFQAAPRLLLLADHSVTPKNQVRSRYQFNLGGEIPLPYATPLFNYRRMNYAGGAIDTYTPGVRVEPAPWLNVEVRHGLSHNLNNTITSATSLRANVFVGDTLAPYLAFTHGSEAIPPQSEAFSNYYTAGAAWTPSRTWGLRADYSLEDRRGFYVRHSVGSGVTFKF